MLKSKKKGILSAWHKDYLLSLIEHKKAIRKK